MYKILLCVLFINLLIIHNSHAVNNIHDIKIKFNNAEYNLKQDKDHISGIIADTIIPSAYEGTYKSKNCDNNPQYYCYGIMLSSFEKEDMYWTKTNPPSNKLSMTYFQKATTLKTQHPIYNLAGGSISGYMLWPQTILEAIAGKNNAFIPNYRCIYPIDADSSDRVDNGCGGFSMNDIQNQPCQSIGINDAQSWLDKYTPLKVFQTCGFSIDGSAKDKSYFQTVKQIQLRLNAEDESTDEMQWDEVILAPWASDEPARIPLMAFYYIASETLLTQNKKNNNKISMDSSEGLLIAQKQQLNYYNMTQIFSPIIRISGATWNDINFAYLPEEQSSGIPEKVNMFPQ